MKEDDCRCTKYENLELMLIAIKHSLRKKKQNDVGAKLKANADIVHPLHYVMYWNIKIEWVNL